MKEKPTIFEKCSECSGSGEAPWSPVACEECHGTGWVISGIFVEMVLREVNRELRRHFGG